MIKNYWYNGEEIWLCGVILPINVCQLPCMHVLCANYVHTSNSITHYTCLLQWLICVLFDCLLVHYCLLILAILSLSQAKLLMNIYPATLKTCYSGSTFNSFINKWWGVSLRCSPLMIHCSLVVSLMGMNGYSCHKITISISRQHLIGLSCFVCVGSFSFIHNINKNIIVHKQFRNQVMNPNLIWLDCFKLNWRMSCYEMYNDNVYG